MSQIEHDTYPPAQHVLRDLRAEFEQRGDGLGYGWLPIVDFIRNPSGSVHAGVLATLVDLLGGGLAATTVAPDWIATADLTLHVLPRPAGNEVEAVARVLRAGRTTAVIEVELHDDAGALGLATMSFARLIRREDNPQVPPPGTSGRGTLALPDSRLIRRVVDQIGFVTVDAAAGEIELPLTPYIGNTLGAVQGGVVATAIVVATDAIVGAKAGTRVETVDLQVTYLSLVKAGPLRTVAHLVDANTADVSVLDANGRVATSATAVAVEVA
ncbi:MAG: PaaI family thioesterase [Acidimicrobiia bacterium]